MLPLFHLSGESRVEIEQLTNTVGCEPHHGLVFSAGLSSSKGPETRPAED